MLASHPLRRLASLASLPLALALAGCTDSIPAQRPEREAELSRAWQAHTDSVARADSMALAVRYVAVPIPTAAAFAALAESLGAEGLANVLRVNRIDLGHVRRGDTLWVPSPMRPREALSPFPRQIADWRDVPDLLVVSNRIQAFAVYDSGRLVRWGPTSTGRREMPTTPGLYHTNWKSRRRASTMDDEWILEWAVNIHNARGITLHLYDLPGHPASHACVRLLLDDAQYVYDWMKPWTLSADGREVIEHGHPVVVFGEYAWDEPAPWRRLDRDPGAATVREAELSPALARWLPRPAATGSAPIAAR